MNKSFFLLSALAIALLASSCNREEIDKQKPEIISSVAGAFPLNCDTLYLGESFSFKMRFSDNLELGSYSIDIHHNFDHHSHSTEVNACTFEPDKTPVNPFLYIQDFAIPGGLKEYDTNIQISIPDSNAQGLFDTGDYHFFISLTDKTGWSAQKGLSIKILRR